MKLKEFKDYLKKKRISFAILFNTDSTRPDTNMFYFSQYRGIGALVIPAKSKPLLFVPEMEYEKAKKSKLKVVKWAKKKRLFEFIKENLRKRKIKSTKIGIDKKAVTLMAHDELKRFFSGIKVDISTKCSELRLIKTPEEIRIIKKSCRIASKIISGLIKSIKSRKIKKESEAVGFLDYETRKAGCELSFEPIVASGIGAREPHYVSKNTGLRKGFCVIDFGVRYKGYCSDITRTVYIGKISPKEKEIYEIALKAQKNIISQIKTGKRCSKLYEHAVKELGKYGKYFIHGLGHGIGIRIHEFPNLSPESKEIIKPGMTFTIEPGIYLKSFGIRIEDDILAKKNGIEVMTAVSKNY